MQNNAQATFNPSDVMVWSADVPDEQTLMQRLGLMPDLNIIKIDRLGAETMGPGIITRLGEQGKRVFFDAKDIEIPTKLGELAKLQCRHRPWMLNCMAGGISNGDFDSPTGEQDHRDGLKRFADACHSSGVLPCGVTVLTSKKPKIIKREFGGRTSIEQVLLYMEWLLEAGFTDAVCSTAELPAIRAESRFDNIALNVPGIRLPDSSTDDQARVGTPDGALKAGATRLVIGRELTNDPANGYAKIAACIP